MTEEVARKTNRLTCNASKMGGLNCLLKEEGRG